MNLLEADCTCTGRATAWLQCHCQALALSSSLPEQYTVEISFSGESRSSRRWQSVRQGKPRLSGARTRCVAVVDARSLFGRQSSVAGSHRLWRNVNGS